MISSEWPQWHCPEHLEELCADGSELVCPRGHRYPERGGIPQFVEDASYADPFGLQWKRFRLTQLDSHSGLSLTSERAKRCLGSDLWEGLEGKQVLECGCGAGRFTEVLLARGARVTSVDLSSAVEANLENFLVSDSHRIAMADVGALPFARRQFDVVFCLGVVQHTPVPEATVAQLYEQVRPGGWLVIDHYTTYDLSWYTKSAPLFRRYLRRLPPEAGLAATERIVNLFIPLHERTRGFRLGQMALSRISPVLYYGQALLDLDDELVREWALLDTHDSLTDWYKHRRTRKQIRTLLEALGLSNVWCEYGGNGVEARGQRP